MDVERERIQDDLRGLVRGEVRCDDVTTRLYATDASIYEIPPLAVVSPNNAADVVACVQYCQTHRISLHARGSGSGLAGGCLGTGLVLDFSKAMSRVLDHDDNRVRVQPGIVRDQLNNYLRPLGQHFGPDPAASEVTTVGGMIAVNGSGSHWPAYGAVADKVESVRVVLADGSDLYLGRHEPVDHHQESQSPRKRELIESVAQLLSQNQATIAATQPKSLVNSSGYGLHGVLQDGYINMARLLAGSEGTLGLVVEATLVASPLPAYTGVMLLLFDKLDKAAKAALELRRYKVAACDLVERRLLALAREADVRYDLLLPAETEAVLLVEVEGDEFAEANDRIRKIAKVITRRRSFAFDSRIALDREDAHLFWRLSRQVVPSLSRLQGNQRPIPCVEDIAVPPDALPAFLVTAQNILKSHQVTASLFAHASHGQIHLRPFLDLGNEEDVEKMRRIADELYIEVGHVGGTIAGEHGDGLSRAWHVRRQWGPLYPVFRELKRIFDPHDILNPGKVTADLPQPVTRNLRPISLKQLADAKTEQDSESLLPLVPSAAVPTKSFPWQLRWENESIEAVTQSCNGCGSCRTMSPAMRMCPIYRAVPAEEASPRAKANMMREILTGRITPSEETVDRIKEVADLCVNCKQCHFECPAGVDIPKLMIEAKAQHVADHGLKTADWVLGNLDKLAAWGTRFRSATNYILADIRMRWLLEKLTGIAQGRKLPQLAKRTFLNDAARRRLTIPVKRSGQKVLYFTDVYANYFDLQLGQAMTQVFQHNGITIYVPPEQKQAAMALISMGAIQQAKSIAQHNVTLLADAVRQGYTIIATEPAAALCLRVEYPNLLEDEDARLVADNAFEACEYLWRLHQQGHLELDFNPLNLTVGYHQPCHIRALTELSAGENLLRLIPGLSVKRIDRGCSGMAGTYGLQRANYRNSLRAGWALISAMRSPTLQAGSTECSCCKIQMEQGTSKPTIHPLKLLALSYGLMPELATLLTRRPERLVIS